MALFDFFKEKPDKQKLLAFDLDKETTSESVVMDDIMARGGITAIPYELSQTPRDELELIQNYRNLAAAAEVDEALQEIRNEVFIFDVLDKKAFEIDFDEDVGVSRAIRKKIEEEFDYLYNLIDFDTFGVQWFDDWFVDGKLYLHKVIDTKNPKKGILRVKPIDPLKIRKLRILPQKDRDGVYDINQIREVYLYNPQAFDNKLYPFGSPINLQYGHSVQGLQIAPEAITYVNSGLFDRNMGKYVGYLKKAIVPYNNLKMMEDALVIFRVVRAPSRRAFYIDVGGLQKNKAEAYIRDLMAKFKNKMVYDTRTGTLSDKRNVMSMMEDYWLPRREGRATEITTIEGQSAQDMMDEVEYFRDKLWRALGVPRSRFGQDGSGHLVFGKSSEIQRDEYRFTKFLGTLRRHFILFMEDLLRTQLELKNIIAQGEWDEIRSCIRWVYTEDNAFVEYKESEILANRLNALGMIDQFVGKYYSVDWVRRHVLYQSEADIEEIDKQIETEKEQYDDVEQNRVDRPDEGDDGQEAPDGLGGGFGYDASEPTGDGSTG